MFDYKAIQIDEQAGAGKRTAYWEGLDLLIHEKLKESAQIRKAYITPGSLVQNREAYRQEYIKMLGWPLTELSKRKFPTAKKVLEEETDFLSIYRLTLETLPGVWFEGLLFVPAERREKAPLVILNPGGTYCVEELIAHGDYDCGQYKNIGGKFLEWGAIVYAPQFALTADPENGFEQPATRQHMDVMLKAMGGSIAAVEIYNTISALDYLIAEEPVDPHKIGTAGLSYGGFYSLYIAAAETRIRSVFSSCFFCNRFVPTALRDWSNKGGCRSDWLWQDSANTFLDAEVAALIAPRALYIENGAADSLFPLADVYQEQERLKPFYEAAGVKERLLFHIGNGGHEVDSGLQGVDFFLKYLSEA